MNNGFEKQNMSFKKHTGKEVRVSLVNTSLLTNTHFGNIFYSNAEIGDRKRKFITKRYYDRKRAEKAFRNYSLAKKARLKVFPTFRIGEDKKSILMTTGFKENEICVGSNIRTGMDLDVLKLAKIEEIEDLELDTFLENFFNEGLKAAKSGLLLTLDDSAFFILSKNKPTKIDFVLGDLDNLKEATPGKYIGMQNMRRIKEMLDEFRVFNISPSFSEKFLKKVEEYYKQAIENVTNSNLPQHE